MNIIEVYEESPNGYVITSKAPDDAEDAIRYYLRTLEVYDLHKNPMEYGVTHLGMAKVLFRDKKNNPEERAKRVENALYYFNQALEAYPHKDYPIMNAITNLYSAQCFRERSMLINNRTFLSERSTPEESIQYAIDHALEALAIFSISKGSKAEYSICCMELGHCYILQSEFLDNTDDNSLREQALTYLDRGMSLAKELPSSLNLIGPKGKVTRWYPSNVTTYPSHVLHLLDGNSISYIDGCSNYLLGRLYQGWGLYGAEDNIQAANNDSGDIYVLSNSYIQSSFEFFSQSLKPKYLPFESNFWSDAHHRIALLVIRYPDLIDPEYYQNKYDIENPFLSDFHLDSAISHLEFALKCPNLTRNDKMDLNFHLGQSYISKLQLIIDKVPFGSSVTAAIIKNDGIELMNHIESNLREALKRVSAANTQSVQDAYLYFYSCLKMAEYRMLQAACIPSTNPTVNREENLKDALSYIIDASVSRPLPDNMDLHYIATGQMAQVMIAVRRTHGASKAYGKLLFCLTALINRAIFNSDFFEKKLVEDTAKHTTQAMLTACKETVWIKLHLGPSLLHEKVAAGYANWSFEDIPSTRHRKQSNHEDNLVQFTGSKTKARLKGAGNNNLHRVVKPVPPKGVPPLKLPTGVDTKKVYIGGQDMPEDAIKDGKKGKKKDVEFLPPAGPVPLSALGHSIPDDIRREEAAYLATPAVEDTRAQFSPYTDRLRSKIPPIAEMKEIDKVNRIAFGFAKGKVFLLPNVARVTSFSATPSELGTPPPELINYKVTFAETIDDSKTANSPRSKNNGEDGESGDKNEEEEGEGEGAGGEEGNEDGEGEAADTAANPKIAGRMRSKRIRGNQPPPPPSRGRPRGNQFGWLFSDNKRDEKKRHIKRKKTRTIWMQIKGLFKGKKKKQEELTFSDSIGMWASKQAFYAFMIHSRQARMELIIRNKRLQLLDGKRACTILQKTNPKYIGILYRTRLRLLEDCAKLVTPPSTLKELSQLSMDDLSILFRSHAKIAAKLDDLEHFLYFKMSKADYFIPMIATAPVFSRDVASFDEALLDANALMTNISFEKTLQKIKEANLKASNEIGGAVGAAGSASNAVATLNKAISHSAIVPRRRERGKAAIRNKMKRANASNSAEGLNEAETKQEAEEKEDVMAGKMTYSLSQALDGSGYIWNGQQGAKDMLIQYLAHDECLLIWHLPNVPTQSLSAVLVWRENSKSKHKHYSSRRAHAARMENDGEEEEDEEEDDNDDDDHSVEKSKARNKSKSKSKRGSTKKSEATGIVIEFAKCDLQTTHLLQFIQRYLDSLHAPSAPMRVTLTTDALRSLSCALSITELLLMIPSKVRSLIICCPPIMRLIPWHLLLIETTKAAPSVFDEAEGGGRKEGNAAGAAAGPSNDTETGTESDLTEIHLLEKYCVRLGPTLSIFELCSIAGSQLKHSPGMHRMCAVDGDNRAEALATGKSSSPDKASKASKVAGIRGADLETIACSTTWSADPEDSYILADNAASPSALETSVFYDRSMGALEALKKFSNEIRMTHKEHEEQELEAALERKKRRKELAKRKRGKGGGGKLFDMIAGGGEGDEDGEGDEEDEEAAELAQEEEELSMHAHHVYVLTMCRVLHISANKVSLVDQARSQEQVHAAVSLPSLEATSAHSSPRRQLTAQEFARQIFIKNCALCVLSRFGLTDDILEISSAVVEANSEFVEAVHLSGASTVLVPLWDGDAEGIGAISRLVFLIRFYSILPSKSRDRISVIEACRRTQLWMRTISANDVIAFIQKAPLPVKARDAIIKEMEAYVVASLAETIVSSTHGNSNSSSRSEINKNPDANRPGGSRLFFAHFLYWGQFAVSGHGGNVHHPNLTDDNADEEDAMYGVVDDAELNNIEFEAAMLRMEGKITEARMLEARIRELRRKRRQQRINAMKNAGWRAGRGLLDGIDFLDKTFLYQDSDEDISVSEGEEDEDGDGGGGGGRDSKAMMARKTLKDVQSNKNKEIDFSKWRSKVGGLDMNVKKPTLPLSKQGHHSIAAASGVSPNKKDSYEYALAQAAKRIGTIEEESSGNDDDEREPYESSDDSSRSHSSDGSDEESRARRKKKIKKKQSKYKKNQRKKPKGEDETDSEEDKKLTPSQRRKKAYQKERERRKRAEKERWKEIRGNVRSYSEIVQMLSEQPTRFIKGEGGDKAVQDRSKQQESCIIS